MGTSTSVAQLTKKFGRLADGMRDTRAPLNATALHVKKIMQTSAASSNALGRKPTGKRKEIGVRYNVRVRDGGGFAVISYVGPAHLINNPTARHFIGASAFGSRGSRAEAAVGIGAVTAFGGSARGMLAGLGRQRRRTRGSGKRALTIGSDLRSYAFHPGTEGKQFFQRAKAEAYRSVPRVYARAGLTEPLRRAFAA